MSRPLRLPAVVDLLRVEAPDEIRALSRDPRLDRRFEQVGPLLNRIIAGRIRRVLRIGATPLPPVAPRDAPGRGERSAELEASLAARLAEPCGQRHLEELAAHVLGRRDPAALGPLVQEVVGATFVPGYRGSRETWEAACLLDAAVRSFNPFRRLAWALGGSVARARGRLAAQVAGDPSAVHATGIAVHNLVRAFERMRDLAAQRWAAGGVPAEAAASRCLAAPRRVLRQATAGGTTAAGEFRPGTLVSLDLEAARARSLGAEAAFLTGSWSRCPAAAWVPALLASVWARAAAEREQEGVAR